MSDGGALLDHFDAIDVPDLFELVIPADDVVMACRVAHRTGGKIGVQYISLPRRASRVLLDPNRDGRMATLKAWLGTRWYLSSSPEVGCAPNNGKFGSDKM